MNTYNNKKFLEILLLILVFFVLILVISEFVLRVFPVYGTKIRCTKYDELVGVALYPNSTTIYSNREGDFVKRKVNSWGYLDEEREREKKEGVYRIGFFGDSYVEAMQVPLKDTFFRIIQQRLYGHNIECLAFAISGRGVLQSYLDFGRRAEEFDIDLAVYVFCENDLGDNIKDIKREKYFPYALLEKNSLKIDLSFREKSSFRESLFYRFYLYLKTRSLAIATLATRINLLKYHVIKTKLYQEDKAMATEGRNGDLPIAIDPPSVWPDAVRDYAKDLGERIIAKWMVDAQKDSRDFAILYIPREREMRKETEYQDSWKYWLESFCKDKDIVFIDPTDYLIKMEDSDKEVFGDHFTVYGHKAFAEAFSDWFIQNRYKDYTKQRSF